MKRKVIRLQRSTVLILAGIVVLGTGVATAQASKPAPNHKVTLCHRTGSATGGNQHNGYSIITVDIASVANAKDVRGHDSHNQIGNGPGGDIIPSYTYLTFTYPGKNLGSGGAEFLANGCMKPSVPPTTVPPTTVPPTTVPPTTVPPTTIPPTTIPPTTIPPTTVAPVTVGGVGAVAPPAAKPPAANPPGVSVLGVGAAVTPAAAAANPLPAAASAGAADTGGQLVAGGFAAFAGFLMLVAGFVLRRRHGEI